MSSSTVTDDVAGAERGAAFCSAVDDALKNGKPAREPAPQEAEKAPTQV